MKFPIGADGQSRPSVPAIAADVASTNRGAHDFAKNCWSDPCPGAILLEKRPDESNDAGRGMDETRERRMDHTLVRVLITSLVACAPAWAGDQELDVFGAPRGGDTTYAGGISAHGLLLTAMPCRLRLPKRSASVRLTLGTASVGGLATSAPASFNTASSARTGKSHSNVGARSSQRCSLGRYTVQRRRRMSP